MQTDASGSKIQHYEYSVFGQSRFTESTTAFPTSQRYTAQVLDEETGLYFYGARYYDPQLGRFIQPDTIIPHEFDPQCYNRYAYALNNPLKIIDPTGHWGKEVANWWSARINAAFLASTAGSESMIWIGTLGTVNSVVGGLSEPLRLGVDAGRVSAEGGTTGEVILVGVLETSRLVALLPAGYGLGKGANALVKVVKTAIKTEEKQLVGEVVSDAAAEASAGGKAAAKAAGKTAKTDPLTEAARAAMGKGPNAVPGSPLTDEMIAGLKRNLTAAEEQLANNLQGLSASGTELSEEAAAAQAALAQQRIDLINEILDSGVVAPKN